MSNFEAVERSIAALKELGHLEDVDAARVEMLRSLAKAVDEKPHSPGLWHEYREALEGLRADDGDDGDVEALLRELSAPVRDEKAS